MSAVVRVVRSGRTEAVHHASVAVVDASGSVVAAAGDLDTPFYGRSALKPFQAQVSLRFGASLKGEDLALVCASHGGTPAHLTIVERVLAAGGLTEDDLGTPAAWPNSAGGRDTAVRAGATEPRRLFHNCSGKHAGMLRACLASGLPIDTYLSPGHPLQAAIAEDVHRLTGEDFGLPGVDGCGAPVQPMTVTGLARAFATLATDPERAEVHDTMRDHPVLIGEAGRVDGVIGSALGGASKIGAEGSLGIAVSSHGLGVAMKVWDGSSRALEPLASAVLERLGLLAPQLARQLEIRVLGGGRTVGWLEADVEWSK